MKHGEFRKRRKKLMDMLGDDSIAILPAAPEKMRNRDVAYRYRQDSDFYYLTGFAEPEAVVALIPGRSQGEFVLFCRERNREQEIWHGTRAGLEGACADYGADDAYPITDLDDILPGLLENRERIYYTMGNNAPFDQRVLGWVNQVRGKARSGIHAPEQFVSLNNILHDMRLYKSRHEISMLRKAAAISATAHMRAMRSCRPGKTEYQIEAELIHEFMRQGAHSAAYPSIVGSGANSCVLHYIDNTRELEDGDILLIDAGAEYQSYASDVTRTFPVNGRFSNQQQAIYEIVCPGGAACCNRRGEAGQPLGAASRRGSRGIDRGTCCIGDPQGKAENPDKEKAYSRYFMHKTGHWLGMDVHDVGDYKVGEEWRLLEPGMVMTVEPGLYFPREKAWPGVVEHRRAY